MYHPAKSVVGSCEVVNKWILSALLLSVIALNASAVNWATLLADRDEVETFTGTQNVKVVFTSEGSLYYVDYSESNNPSVHEIIAESEAAIPVISPDGNWITYATGTSADANTNSPSTAWLVEMKESATPIQVSDDDKGFVPRFVQDQINTPTVLYSTCGTNPGSEIWNGCGKMYKRAYSGGSFGNPVPVYEGGSYHGGLSYDNRYMCAAENDLNGFILDLENASSGPSKVHTIEVTKNADGSDTVWSMQTCNPSISASEIFTDAILYLDMGGSSIASSCKCTHAQLGSGQWNFHGRMFISRSDGKVYKFIDPIHSDYDIVASIDIKDGKEPGASITELQWEHCEWTNHPYFAASAMKVKRRWYDPSKSGPIKWIDRNLGEEIYLVNLKEDKKLKIMEVDDKSSQSLDHHFQFVWIWVEKPQNFDEDENWLKNDISPVVQPTQLRSVDNGIISARDNVISASSDIKKVAVFNVQGELIRAIDVSRKSITLNRGYFSHSGLYLVKAETANGAKASFRWVVSE
ncbi:MAG: hypothetical protein GF398_06785 [Chitinivibrionales bacterium]|nr:hypothetical protein [Chitinivibrionales bacterium]